VDQLDPIAVGDAQHGGRRQQAGRPRRVGLEEARQRQLEQWPAVVMIERGVTIFQPAFLQAFPAQSFVLLVVRNINLFSSQAINARHHDCPSRVRTR
jgi:hypothetical protein